MSALCARHAAAVQGSESRWVVVLQPLAFGSLLSRRGRAVFTTACKCAHFCASFDTPTRSVCGPPRVSASAVCGAGCQTHCVCTGPAQSCASAHHSALAGSKVCITLLHGTPSNITEFGTRTHLHQSPPRRCKAHTNLTLSCSLGCGSHHPVGSCEAEAVCRFRSRACRSWGRRSVDRRQQPS